MVDLILIWNNPNEEKTKETDHPHSNGSRAIWGRRLHESHSTQAGL